MKPDIIQCLIFLCVITYIILTDIDVSHAQQASFLSDPSNTTLCLTQRTTAVFICLINRGSSINIDSIRWYKSVGGGQFESVKGRPRHMIDTSTTGVTLITGELTVTDVTVNDNGTQYRCQPNNSNLISNVATLTVLDAPPIDSITVVEACRNDFTVSWTATSNEIRLSYNVTLSPPSSVALITTMDNSYNFTGLMPNTTYAVTIRAGEVVQCLGAPTTMMIATPTSGPVVRNILMLRDVSRTNTSITINWYPDETSYCGPVICYNVAIRNFSFIFTDKTTETNFKFSNLMSRTSYNISVAAINRAGTGPASAITLTTLTDDEDGTSTPTINSISVDGICTNDFTISWVSISNDIGLSYTVKLSPSNQTLTTVNTSYNFTNLISNVTYNVTVAADIGIPAVIMVATLTVETGRPMGVLNLRNTERTRDTITIEWDATDSVDCGPVLYYVVVIRNLVISCDINYFNVTVPRADFHNLISSITYAISVAAVNRAGVGVETTINVTTLAATSDRSQDSLSNGEVAVITAVICCVVCVMATTIITFVITAYCYKKNDKPIMITQPVVGKTDVMEYEEITKASSDDMAMTTNPSYDVAMTSNPAYGHNVKKID